MIQSAFLALALALLAGCATLRPGPAEPGSDGARAGADPARAERGDGAPEGAPGAEASPPVDGDAAEPRAEAQPEPREGGDAEADDGAPAEDDDRGAPEDPGLEALRARILAAARRRLGTHPALDCSGFVLDAYRAAGLAIQLGPGRSRSESLHDASRPVKRPHPGDLAFFHDTYDRNRDGRLGDLFTHVALVEAVDGDTITLLHRGGRVERIRMDLAHPSDPDANGQLRLRRRRDPRGARYLAGELFAAFGELLTGEFTRTLQVSHAGEARVRQPATR